jgi:hypothetical protein
MWDGGEFDDEQRAARACTRVDLPPVEPAIVPQRLRVAYMGRHPIPGVTSEHGLPINPEMPLEDIDNGCPGGWYRSRFVRSLDRYLRLRVEGGARVSNPLLHRCKDDFVLQCEQLYTHEQERAANHLAKQATK